ncbi:MAG: hypothetical protein KIT46_07735 [Anaerolineales bacterium]|nr:hypothetical protein [Anaerolineales bacterium]MCW5855920.1 hypothetical protein [Anaerolineales bacterium]
MSIQAFHASLFAQDEQPALVTELFNITEASLSEVLAVRSELAWDAWTE